MCLAKNDAMVQALIQHRHKNSGKMVLQTLIPFKELVDVVLFTCKANPKGPAMNNYQNVAEENYKYYQRRIDTGRLRNIQDFICNSILSEARGYSITALFPSALILAINEDDGNQVVMSSESSCSLDLQRNIFIVDGQHRMMAMKSLYESLKGSLLLLDDDQIVLDYLEKYKFNCVVLVNYDLWEQGQVFVNVNFKQKPVNKSLYYEIFGSDYDEDPSMWKRNHVYLAHTLTKVLNTHESSPYQGHIKMLGTGKGYVSQAFFVEALMRHFALGGIWSIYKTRIKSDSDIRYMAVELLSYFAAVKDVFKEYWPKEEDDRGSIICKTTGTGAFVRLMYDIHQSATDKEKESLYHRNIGIADEYYQHVKEELNKVTKVQADRYFGEKSKYYGSSGRGSEVNMYNDLKSSITNKYRAKDVSDNLPTEDVIVEQIQEYMVLNVLPELDCLGHSYEFEDLSDLTVNIKSVNEKRAECRLSFISGVTIYLDSDDDSGFTMAFPSKASCDMILKNERWVMDQSSMDISVDTSKYYQ